MPPEFMDAISKRTAETVRVRNSSSYSSYNNTEHTEQPPRPDDDNTLLLLYLCVRVW